VYAVSFNSKSSETLSKFVCTSKEAFAADQSGNIALMRNLVTK